MQRTVLGSELPTPSPKPSPAGVGAMRRLRTPLDDLTAREREVLELMGEGLTNAGIAERLFISNGAVEKHTQRLFAKLGLSPDASVHRRVSAVLTLLGR